MTLRHVEGKHWTISLCSFVDLHGTKHAERRYKTTFLCSFVEHETELHQHRWHPVPL